MKRLILISLVIIITIDVLPQTWQALLPAPGAGVTDMVYWSGGGVNFGNKLWVSTSSYNWPNGQWGGVFWNETFGLGGWRQVAGGYIARTLEVGQDGNLYASIWQEPAFTDADALCRFTPQAGIFGTLYQASAGDNIFSIAVKNTPHTIYGGTRNGVIRSTDNGVSFGYSNTGIPDSAWVYDIAIDSTGILAIASSKGVFISTDNGNNWLTTTGIPPEDTVKTLLFIRNSTLEKSLSFRQDDNLLVILNGSGHNPAIYKSLSENSYAAFFLHHIFDQIVPDGSELSEITYGRFSEHIKMLASVTPILAGGRNLHKVQDLAGVYESTDDGISWNQINNGLPPEPPVSALALKIINETSAEIYAGLFNDTTNGAGVYKLSVTVDIEEVNNQIPSDYKLEQNYPNPFNPSTTIQFSIPRESFTRLEVFNTLGEKISTLVSETLQAGTYKYEWDAAGLPSGAYFYRLSTENFVQTKKLLLMK